MHFIVPLAAAAALVSATPIKREDKVITLPLTYRRNNVKNAKSLVAKGQQRIAKVNGQSSNLAARQDFNGQITNDDVSYTAEVTIGGSNWDLIVDSGSSNLWCGAQSSCEPSSTGQNTGDSVSVSYGSGSFSGEEYTDDVSFAGATVNGQSLGAASSSQGFNGVDGIIGFGPVDLTQGTVQNTNEVPTFMDNLYNQGTIGQEVLGVSFRPESGSDNDDTNGELTLGGVDSSKYSGSLSYFPKATSGASSNYWGINIDSFSYNGQTLDSNQEGIVDTGTTLIMIEQTAYNNFLSATGGSTDQNCGLASFTNQPQGNFGFTFSGQTFDLTPDQYLLPQDQYSEFGCASGKYYAWFANGGTGAVSTIIGQKFIEQYYTVFDTTNSRIGFAPGN